MSERDFLARLIRLQLHDANPIERLHRFPPAARAQVASDGPRPGGHGAGPAHRHRMAAMRNSNFYELTLVHPKVYGFVRPNLSGYADMLDAIDAEGCMDVPQGPGLGVEWDREHLRGYQVDEIVID